MSHRLLRIFFILTFTVSSVIYGVTDQHNYSEQKFGSSADMRWWEHRDAGHRAFGEQDYDLALSHYKKAQELIKKDPGARDYTDNSSIPVWIKLVQHRKNLGKIKPEYVHRILMVYIDGVDARVIKENKVLPDEHYKSQIKEQDMKRTLEHIKHFRSVLEAMTDGHLSIEYETEYLPIVARDFEITRFTQGKNYEKEVRQFLFEGLANKNGTPYDLGQFLIKNMTRFDTFIWYWDGEGFATTANGGGYSYPLVPYQMYTDFRGYISAPSQWTGTVIHHEFFHITEWMGGIRPTHGYLDFNRDQFPEWKGKEEYDYQWWHWKNKLLETAWRDYILRYRYPSAIDPELVKINKKLTAGIPHDDMRMAWYYSRQGEDLQFNKKDLPTAWKMASQALALNPWNPKALRTGYDYHYYVKEDYKSARDYLEKLNTVAPKWWSLNLQSFVEQWKLKDYTAALNTLNKTFPYTESREQSAQVYQNMAYAWKALEKHEQSYTAFEKSVSLSTNVSFQSASLWGMGDTSFQIDQDYDRALPHYLKAAQLTPLDWRYRNIAWIYQWKLKDYPKAIQYLGTCIDMTEDKDMRADAWMNTGRAYTSMQQYADARKALYTSLQTYTIQSKKADPYWYLGDTYEKENEDWGSALKYFAESIKIDPAFHRWNHVAWIQQWKLKKLDSAVLSYDKAIALSSEPNEIGPAYLWQGRAYMDNGQPQKALESLEKSLKYKSHPYYPEALFWKGFILADKLKRIDEGLIFMEQGIKGGYDNNYSQWALKKYQK